MKYDDNWYKTRCTCEDLQALTGVPKSTSSEFLNILENLIVHQILIEYENLETKDNYSIVVELPYLGSLIVEGSSSQSSISIGFKPRGQFYDKIKKSIITGTSSLADQIADMLGKSLENKYNKGEI